MSLVSIPLPVRVWTSDSIPLHRFPRWAPRLPWFTVEFGGRLSRGPRPCFTTQLF